MKARIPNFLSLIALSCFAIASLAPAARGEDPKAQWVWLGGGEESQKVAFRKSFEVGGDVKQARIAATCDNVFQLFLNGQPVLSGDSWNRLESVDVTAKLKPGKNTLAALGTDEGGLAGFILRMDVVDKSGKVMTLVTDASWKGASAATPLAANWNSAGFDDASWKAVAIKGAVGAGNLPWSDSVDAAALAVAAGQPPKPVDARPVPAENVTAKNGFRVEKLFDVPSQMGSWVSLSTDGKGRLIASDQGNAGLYMIEPAAIGKPDAITKVTKLPVDLSSAQGLLWAHDSLYVVVNGGKSGLHRAKDTDGDGLVDSSEYLMKIDGGGEHGPHAVILAPDGQSLLVDAGNHTKLPEISGSRIPTNWGEDHVLPRRWDANGHAAGILAPGGWICKVDPDGKKWEVVSMGYRNQYDIALNADGELFSYDADMEWDFGSPWYRPTRIVHATSGSEFGWRSGTGKWPTYYEDSLPPAVDIGPGSPVGVTFGYGTKYPAKYQKALYVLDWTYSTIYACHLTPDGSSYKGEIEDFVYGQPMQVTDATVGPDGALYFTVGGRGTKSALMRVVYEGDESTAPVNAKDEKNRELREVRRQLEAFHRPGDADMNLIWSQLGHADRFIRYAARIALENRPVDAWKAKALAETNPRSALTALMALARQGAPEDRGAVLAALGRINPKQLELQEQLTWLRNHQLALVRLGEVTEQERAELIKRLEPLFPSDNNAFNTELMQLLIRLESPEAVKRGVAMMQKLAAEAEPIPPWGEIANRNAGYGGTARAMMDNMPPIRSIAYAFALRNAKTGWTEELRKAYLAFFSKAAMHPGGASYPGFLKQSRDDALANVPTNELPLYDEILSVPLGGKPFEATPPKGPGKKWTKDDALTSLGSEIKGANFDAGRNLFHATQCAKCHRFSGEGGAIGPDLSTAGRKFALPDMMDAILDPSKAISDQYGSHQVVTSDGKTLVGRVVELGDQLQVYTADVNVPPQTIKKDDVEEMVVSKVSQMPTGTVDTLNPEELKHLIAFIMSGGDRNAPYFKP